MPALPGTGDGCLYLRQQISRKYRGRPALRAFDAVIRFVRRCALRVVLVSTARSTSMSVALRILDDGAWISVNDERRVSVSELWRFHDPEFCACTLPDLVVENFQAVGVDGRTVETRVYGQCIACGTNGETPWLPVGRLVDGEYRDIDRESVLRSTRPPHAHGSTTNKQ